ncbi:MAG: hypothetical protein K6U14_07265 [Firmicutes bacterium]|nr:hypothetical protein [Alicyclobacillaceae bacterium]MCL6497417.1 hypothetical protein [Bacillota bacterium]
MKVRCFLLGAGASYGYDDALPWEERPPLTDQVFTAAAQRRVLEKQEFEDLRRFFYFVEQGRPVLEAVEVMGEGDERPVVSPEWVPQRPCHVESVLGALDEVVHAVVGVSDSMGTRVAARA